MRERQSRFCSHCAGKMERIDGTWAKRCVACRVEHFPLNKSDLQ
ncbi:MAG: NADH pyrophosphatase zinc ribbon domain-containing protein [Candidatus Omnitrophica bacterium]|nr:NADH pyrophosphatase zinc ribbon domain-containing protein [Candidatus Omnitrophota bacterium]